jgi:hypothetical protein
MNREELIKAAALQIAAAAFGNRELSFTVSDGDRLVMPSELLDRMDVIINYLLDKEAIVTPRNPKYYIR